ncbi:NAD-dependent epimerase/dehydratase family protein [Roseovarius sp. SYSU LYC5161]|uniref:NAD-dependent epimerase/dehydratase family protein n=1 Tax=Roseovarius halophilus (ex Wu et al. 2025) TaxID=3376060 RepID=UPI003999CD1C
MANQSRQPALLVTGAGGRVGRLLRRIWTGPRGAGLPPAAFLSRHPGADITWSPGLPMPDLPACDTVVSLWGTTRGTPEALAENSRLAREGRRLARACGARRVLHFSSAAVYGPGTDLSEDTPPSPLSGYGAAKRDMEHDVAAFDDRSIAHCCLRVANVLGADSLTPNLCPSNDPVTLDRFEDGRGPLRSYVAPGDLARVIAALADLPPDALPPVLNIASGDPVEMADLAGAAGRPVRWRHAPPEAIQAVTLSTGRLTRLLPGLETRKTAAAMIADWQDLEAADDAR